MWLHHFTFSQAVYEDSHFPTLSLTHIFAHFDYRHPTGCEVVFHCVFNMHFPIDFVTENPTNFAPALPAAPSQSHCWLTLFHPNLKCWNVMILSILSP